MTTEQLQYLLEISRNSSITAASQKLHITPQALSTSIKKLEDELGFPLLERSYKGIKLNNNGIWLAEESRLFLQKIADRQAIHSVDPAKLLNGELLVYFNSSGQSNTILSKVICDLYNKAPDLKIDLIETNKENIINLVQTQKIDMGFIYSTTADDNVVEHLPDDIVFQPLFSGRLILLTGPTNELSKLDSITIKKLSKYPLISYSPVERTKTENFLLNNFYNSSVEITTETNFGMFKEKIMHNIANSLAICFDIEDYPINYFENVKILEIKNNIKIYFGFIKTKNSTLSEMSIFFLKELTAQIDKYNKNQAHKK